MLWCCSNICYGAGGEEIMNGALIQFKDVIDEEIQAYESLGELYKIKQSILVQGKSDALWDIDAQIISKAENIKELNKKRKGVARFLGSENLTMTEIIEKAKASGDAIAEKLEHQKTKLNILAKSLNLQEDTNMTLLKHGIIMVGKTLDIIVGAVLPHASQYNNSGQCVENNKSLLSSIVEEA